jgi:hypothetical protein
VGTEFKERVRRWFAGNNGGGERARNWLAGNYRRGRRLGDPARDIVCECMRYFLDSLYLVAAFKSMIELQAELDKETLWK